MTGPEHYREAERLIGERRKKRERVSPDSGELLAEAQVHATLADAAARALPTVVLMMGDNNEVTDWARATGVHPS
jgi:hypothetical protein